MPSLGIQESSVIAGASGTLSLVGRLWAVSLLTVHRWVLICTGLTSDLYGVIANIANERYVKAKPFDSNSRTALSSGCTETMSQAMNFSSFHVGCYIFHGHHDEIHLQWGFVFCDTNMCVPFILHFLLLNVILSGICILWSAQESIKINIEIPHPEAEWPCQSVMQFHCISSQKYFPRGHVEEGWWPVLSSSMGKAEDFVFQACEWSN